MFTVSPMEGVWLAAGILGFTTALVIGVFFAFPRSAREVAAYVRCPMLGRALGARLVRDDWTRRFDRVVRCDALGPCAPVMCNQACLRMRVAVTA